MAATPAGGLSSRHAVRRAWTRLLGRIGDSSTEVFVAVLLVACIVGLLVLWLPDRISAVVFVPVLMLGGMLLPPRRVGVVVAVVGAWIASGWFRQGLTREHLIEGLSMFVVMGLITLLSATRIGARPPTLQGDTMLFDLRDRLVQSGDIGTVPAGWRVQCAVHSAHGEAFSGDFLVTATTQGGELLEVALVDVSGKGREAGTHALVLSGAFGGLLGSLPMAGFLGAANDYVLRQTWDERFATVVHVALDYTTGEYSIARAGHPPAVHYRAGTGTWAVLEGGRGPVLGVLEEAAFPRVAGRLEPGDALLIYTDGVIESRAHRIEDGIDRMLGAATTAMVSGGHTLARDVCDVARAGLTDDRAVFAVIRR